MSTVKYVTTKGQFGSTPHYIGLVQHDRTMSKKEIYAYLAEKLGYKATSVKAVFLALADYVKENADKGNISYLDGVASIRNLVKGGFNSSSGPWDKSKNALVVDAIEIDPFKSALGVIVPVNKTEGASPAINTVFDETTKVYDVITGTDEFSIAGSDLAPDSSKTDEYVAVVSASGVETKAEITYSDLQNVKAKFATAPAAGSYTLKVYTRSGLGSEYGVAVASRKVVIG